MNKISKSSTIKESVILGDNIEIGENVYIDDFAIIKDSVSIGNNSYIGSNCIIGEYTVDCIKKRSNHKYVLSIGENALIRSSTIIYTDSQIGHDFQTGHHVTIRENCLIGDYVSFGTLADIQGNCMIKHYVRAHSNVHIGQKSIISSFVWLFPYVVLTNDPTPPSTDLCGVILEPFSVVSTGSILLPGVHIASDSLVAAGANVVKDVHKGEVVGGNPAKVIASTESVRNHITREKVYPWRYTFDRGMPWENVGFDNWYRSLSEKEIDYYFSEYQYINENSNVKK